IDQYAGALERGDQAAYPCRAHLPQWGQLSAAGAGPRGGDPRELTRAASLPQHGRSARAQKGGAAPCGLTSDPFSLTRARSVKDAARRLCRCRRLRGDILDCRCARRSARRQVGTKGWSFPIEQRDTAIDLKTHPHPLYRINLLNLTHTTPALRSPRVLHPCQIMRPPARSWLPSPCRCPTAPP